MQHLVMIILGNSKINTQLVCWLNYQANTKHLYIIYTMLDQSQRHSTDVV